jgi:hypothetical protein
MKKILLSISGVLLATAFLQGQINKIELPLNQNVSNAEIQALKQGHTGSSANNQANRDILQDLYIDYSFVDNFNQSTTAESQKSFLWRFNSRNTNADTALSFVGVRFFEITGYTDPADGTGSYVDPFSYEANYELIIDSIFSLISHENNSGENDSLIVEIHRLNATANSTFADPAIVLWGDTTITSTSLSTGGNWVGTGSTQFISWAPGITVPAGRRAGVTVKYFGPKQDTCGIVASYISNPDGPASPNDIALKSSAPYSVMKYPPFIPNYSRNSNIFYGSPAAGADTSFFYAQNWEIWIKARVNEVLDIETVNGIKMGHAYPNPFSEITNFTFNLDNSAEIGVQMFDITGKMVYTENMGKRSAGKNNVSINAGNLPAGMYMYRITADGKASVSKKVTIVR